MRFVLIFLYISTCIFGLDNSTTVKNNFTGVLTDHPVWFGKFFARGEIANYCRPYVTLSTTPLVRDAATSWQCDVLNRWPDQSASRTITGATSGATVWSTTSGGGNGDLTSIVVTAGVGVGTTGPDHGLSVGDRLYITGTPTTNQYGAQDNVTIYAKTDKTFTYMSRAAVSNATVTSGNYTSGVVVKNVIDPLEPADACHIIIANHGFYRGDIVTIPSVPGMIIVNPSSDNTYTITGITRNQFVSTLRCTGSYTVGGTVTGTSIGAGSVMFAHVALVTTIPASGNTKIDFINSTNPSSAGDAAATAAAGYDRAEMLAATWNFDADFSALVRTGNTSTITVSARDMLTAWNSTQSYCGPRYWAQGPVRTWLILEHGCNLTTTAATTTTASLPGAADAALPYDFGWKILPGTTLTATIVAADTEIPLADLTNIEVGTVLSGWSASATTENMTVTHLTCLVKPAPCVRVTRATLGTAIGFASGRGIGIKQWVDSTGTPYSSLHPRFDLSFVPGWGVKGSTTVHNQYMWKMQNLWYALDIKTGASPTSRITKALFKHAARNSWRLDTWDGTDPEFYCATSGSDPEACGAGTRTRKYLVDHNTAYMIYSRIYPEYQLFPSVTSLTTISNNFNVSDKGAIVPPTMGSGTYPAPQVPSTSGSTTSIKSLDGEESFVLNFMQAMCLQTWTAACYNLIWADTVPGGAGNVEAAAHITKHDIEDDLTQPRFVMPGFAAEMDSPIQRPPSLYARPGKFSIYNQDDNSFVSNWDKWRTACTSGVAPALLGTILGNTDASGTHGWPCFIANTTGGDGWGLGNDTHYTHQIDWAELAYIMTADPRYLDSIQQYAYWNEANNNATTGDARNVGKSWFNPENKTTLVRAQGGATRAMLIAALLTPNVPQFGYTVPSVETFYFNEQLWNLAFSKEGWFGITDGKFHEFYPSQNLAAACAGTEAKSDSLWAYTHCIIASGLSNPLGIMGRGPSEDCTDVTWINCGAGYGTIAGQWYYHHTSVQWSRAESLGYRMFYNNRRKFANYAFSAFGSGNWNPFLNSLNQLPILKTGPLFVDSFTDMYNGVNVTWGSENRDQQRWCTGSHCNMSNILYDTQWLPDIAAMSDLAGNYVGSLDGCSTLNTDTPEGCTWLHAWNLLKRTLMNQNTYTQIVKFIFAPKAEITNINCTPGGTSVVCTYDASDGNQVTYLVSTAAPTTTLDNADVSDGGGALKRTITVTGLDPSTLYYIRFTGGQKVSGFGTGGTTRTATTFTTLTAGGGTNYVVRLPLVTGATTATIDYGDTTAVDDGSVGPTTCTSGCTLNVPGNINTQVYYRITYKNGGGTTIARGGVQSVIAK